MFGIFLWGDNFKIGESVVGFNSIFVIHLHSAFDLPVECLPYNPVDVMVNKNIIDSESNTHISGPNANRSKLVSVLECGIDIPKVITRIFSTVSRNFCHVSHWFHLSQSWGVG